MNNGSEQKQSGQSSRKQLVITGYYEQSENDPFPPLRGFVRSSFNPLIYHAAMNAAQQAKIQDIESTRKALLLGSLFTDMMTLQETSKDLLSGRKVSPIMFPPSVPSSVMGYIAKELTVHGPLSCISVTAKGIRVLIQQAQDYIEDDQADLVLLTLCDTRSLRSSHWLADHSGVEGSSFAESGGVISLAIETAAQAEKRGMESLSTLDQWLQEFELHTSNSYGIYSAVKGV